MIMDQTSNRRLYIVDMYCISPQLSYNQSLFEDGPIVYTGNRYLAKEPGYANIIPAGMLRRMGKAVRMGVGAGLPLINRNPGIDGIVLGTANGGLEDCLKFLNQIVDYEEGTLTPTNFVQSTPNAVAGSLALMSKNTGYNITHVNKGLAFEAALLDVVLLISEGQAGKILLGGIEEISDYNYNIDLLGGSFKSEEVSSRDLLSSDTPGTVCGEGAAMFVVSTEKSPGVFAEIVDVDQISYPDQETLIEKLNCFLDRNGLVNTQIDTIVAGSSGDNRSDFWFEHVRKSLFPMSSVHTYKDLVGDYPTSSSFALWLGVQTVLGKNIPGRTKVANGKVENVLIYNHYKGFQHGFILLKSITDS